MSQNFSKMSDIYIPELIELDSYWQKAVEDAIYDTLKGEKRLYYALRNRKKINKKLERLGLKPVYSQMSFSGRYHFSVDFNDENQNLSRCKSVSNNTQWDSCCENSVTSLGTAHHDDALSLGGPEFKSDSHSGMGSRSRSKGCRQTPPDKKYRNPERPLLGDGSLEKMKKSQNSFYCEPMGMEESLSVEFSESDNEEEKRGDKPREFLDQLPTPFQNFNDDKNKTVEWLHVRENSFDDSDTEMSSNGTQREVGKVFQPKQPKLKDANYFLKKKPNDRMGLVSKTVMGKNNPHIPMMLDPQEDLFWENEVKNAIRESVNLDRKLHLALAKREIVNENLRFLRMRECGNPIQINVMAAKTAARKGRSKRVLSPFIKFYLEVYRELCQKCPLKQITKEAAARWWGMTLNQQSAYDVKN